MAFYKPITVFDIKGNEIKVIIQKELNNLIIDYKNIFIDNYFDKKNIKIISLQITFILIHMILIQICNIVLIKQLLINMK